MENEQEIKILNIDDILPNRFQPRIHFNDNRINELAESIKKHGVIQPIVVRRVSDKYEIIAGERRYKASKLAGKTTIPALITELDDKNSAEVALIENVQRQDLTPIEEAISYKKILDMEYLTQEQLAEKLGTTQSTVANKLRLLNLHEDVQEALLEGKISERHARSLLKLDGNRQVIMLNRIISERLTVRRTDEEIIKMLNEVNDGNIKEKEREEKKMDEKIVNEFNIPNNPIIEEPVNQPTEEAVVPVQEENQVNPGFMDIDKIESNAEDIFREDVPADLDKLLEKSPEPEPIQTYNPMQPIMEEQPQEEVKQGGRFFNMFGINRPEDTNPNYVGNIENKETNMDFGMADPAPLGFNPFNINVEEPKDKETLLSSMEQPVEQSMNQVESSAMMEQNLNNIGASQMQSNVLQQNSFNNSIDSGSVSQIDPVIKQQETPIYESKVINNDQSDNVAPTALNNFELNQESNMDLPLKEESQNLNDNIQSIDEPPMFDELKPYSLNDNAEFSVPVEPSAIENFENNTINPIAEIPVEQTIPTYENTVAPIQTNNDQFRIVINTLRDCAKTIEAFGYKVDVDEMDLENSYEVTFKIEK